MCMCMQVPIQVARPLLLPAYAAWVVLLGTGSMCGCSWVTPKCPCGSGWVSAVCLLAGWLAGTWADWGPP